MAGFSGLSNVCREKTVCNQVAHQLGSTFPPAPRTRPRYWVLLFWHWVRVNIRGSVSGKFLFVFVDRQSNQVSEYEAGYRNWE